MITDQIFELLEIQDFTLSASACADCAPSRHQSCRLQYNIECTVLSAQHQKHHHYQLQTVAPRPSSLQHNYQLTVISLLYKHHNYTCTTPPDPPLSFGPSFSVRLASQNFYLLSSYFWLAHTPAESFSVLPRSTTKTSTLSSSFQTMHQIPSWQFPSHLITLQSSSQLFPELCATFFLL